MLWKNGALHLPELLWSIYHDELVDRDWMAEATKAPHKPGIHGGQAPEESKEHFCQRFAASCGRVVYFLADPQKSFGMLTKQTLLSLSHGKLVILDVAGGSGAGTLAIATTLAEFRNQGVQPKLPLNITIVNADISIAAQEVAHSLHIRAGGSLLEAGINIQFSSVPWDMYQVEQTNQLCDDLFSNFPDAKEFLILVCNISGLGAKNFDAASDSITHIMQRITNKKAFVLWVEPNSPKAESILKKLAAALENMKQLLPYFKSDVPTHKYPWFNKIKNAINEGRVILQQYLRSY